MKDTAPLSIVVIGASGDLARRKILPALFSLYCQEYLPEDLRVFGFARTSHSDEDFRRLAAEHLTCRYAPGASCAEKMEAFLSRCFYQPGRYDSADAFLDLYQKMRSEEASPRVNRIFYLAIPPSIFLDVARALGDTGLVQCGEKDPWSRVVIEKPFGRDRSSSDLLTKELANIFTEGQTYRIDHYLGKEAIQNLLVLRFANAIFEPIWNHHHVRSVEISWKENLSIMGRGGYFDDYGIIRDVVQNHLLQILSLVAMEPPAGLDSRYVRDEKVKVLRAVRPVTMDNLVVGQYARSVHGDTETPGYVDDESVPDGSRTPTYAAVVLEVENDRWRGVPFLLQAGKGLDARMTEIRIRFQNVQGNLFCDATGCPGPNELLIRVQPGEAIHFRIMNKVPGGGMKLSTTELDMQYASTFQTEIPDAYENLLLDVLRGEKSLFLRSDELAAAWDIFTPVLHRLEADRVSPVPYEFGADHIGPADDLAGRYGASWGASEAWCSTDNANTGDLP